MYVESASLMGFPVNKMYCIQISISFFMVEQWSFQH